MKRNMLLVPALFLAAAILSCSGGGNDPASDGNSTGGSGSTVNQANYDPAALTDAQVSAAAALDVYFQHASVGGNVCAGIDALALASPRYASGRASWASDYSGDSWSPGYDASWYDSHDGLGDDQRGNPGAALKVSYFFESMSGSLADKVDVAMFKFCFIDSPGGDYFPGTAAELFASAKSTMEALEAAHPGVDFVWWTMPIETAQAGAKAERQLYNDAVRAYCLANREWLLDIAALESHDDSGQAIVDSSGRELLYDGYAAALDDSHLNSMGELKLAKAYWKLLALIADSQ
jgi:hypothetical protein